MIYLNKQIVFRNYAERERLYFEKVFNNEYLIEATMYYVENCKTRGVTDNTNEKRFSSISNFLTAYNHFYDIVLKLQYTIPVLLTEELSAEIRVRLEKILNKTKDEKTLKMIPNKSPFQVLFFRKVLKQSRNNTFHSKLMMSL